MPVDNDLTPAQALAQLARIGVVPSTTAPVSTVSTNALKTALQRVN